MAHKRKYAIFICTNCGEPEETRPNQTRWLCSECDMRYVDKMNALNNRRAYLAKKHANRKNTR